MAVLREMNLPLPIKYAVVAWMACTWKWWYYAPNTYKQLKVNQLRRAGKHVDEAVANQPFTLDPMFFIYGHPLFPASEVGGRRCEEIAFSVLSVFKEWFL